MYTKEGGWGVGRFSDGIYSSCVCSPLMVVSRDLLKKRSPRPLKCLLCAQEWEQRMNTLGWVSKGEGDLFCASRCEDARGDFSAPEPSCFS